MSNSKTNTLGLRTYVQIKWRQAKRAKFLRSMLSKIIIIYS